MTASLMKSFLLGILVFPLLALAQVPLNPENLEQLAQVALDAVLNKNWALVASLGVVLAVFVLRKLGAKWIPFLGTDRGGALLVLLTSLTGAIANAILAGGTFGLPLLLTSLTVALSAAGGYSLILKLFFPSDIDLAKEAGEAAAKSAPPAPKVATIANDAALPVRAPTAGAERAKGLVDIANGR